MEGNKERLRESGWRYIPNPRCPLPAKKSLPQINKLDKKYEKYFNHDPKTFYIWQLCFVSSTESVTDFIIRIRFPAPIFDSFPFQPVRNA